MPVFNIHHITKYEYDRPIKESVNEIRIYPFADPTQETLHHQLNITGQPDVLLIKDYWGNQAGMFNLITLHKEMVIESNLILRTVGSSTLQLNQDASLGLLKNVTATNLLLQELSTINETGLKQSISEL